MDWLAPYDTNEKMYEAARRRVSPAGGALGDAIDGALDRPAVRERRLVRAGAAYADLERDPQVAHKGLIWDVPYADSGEDVPHGRLAVQLLGEAGPVRRGAPRAGQHTAEFRARDIWKD